MVQWRPILTSFYHLSDYQNRITYTSLVDKLSPLLGAPGTLKLSERLIDIIGQGFPINLFK